ncbi:hypothetical protein FUAX_05410 [Fulvitalea axinellae]|uniref:phosphoglycolate phosphatase n=1 Tax=Fulvitalea axinellae TaxID=1182444 RepID=A0AAU9CP26_9BACT|nr:hypothetical protein FUAX_05410 [Fulvitalea axinellae]
MKPIISPDTILVFDKDGVLFNSETIKLRAFEDLFLDYPEHAEAIHIYNHESVGRPRAEKFAYILREILKRDDSEEAVAGYMERSKTMLKERLKEAPMIGGLKDFLAKHDSKLKFVCSVAIPEEVNDQLSFNGISGMFEDVFAYPHDKADVLSSIKEDYGDDILFFGDTLTDYEAAVKADVAFVGIHATEYPSPLAEKDVRLIGDYAELA